MTDEQKGLSVPYREFIHLEEIYHFFPPQYFILCQYLFYSQSSALAKLCNMEKSSLRLYIYYNRNHI